ncbi:pyruvate dehydrogenase E1 component subunit alpha [Sphaerisporangium siamense]|uniref:Pyruvate dehydrogenase E1 component alpha subunit n=1 Tax=Sphaerisporangium siamense TaxID=795645 RepID=A0A7W7D3K2_9ACTN|nr:pyruvate dehydrogenase (acetyl-transferring) E1 component subunit alpha [Sphaerisporangium siamense]MBB4699583.1 pyruvate dehydrogenase E1 component alpha subunit [Sphaerisporangium siamense]GII86999.1 pyruvate dehydrogenase E1 component subunit alpha [Sphaerisporangium siamense]
MTDRHQGGRPGPLLPSERPVRFLTDGGTPARGRHPYPEPDQELLLRAYRRMVVGRRFDAQATALTKQGRLAVYPSSRGQEACQVGAVLALDDGDWLFPTYRESVALVTRGIPPVEVLSLLRGDAHCGYDPHRHHVAPQCTPLATQTVHAAGLAYAERRKGSGRVVLVFVGDGATSEGDFHEALNFAAVFRAPVVFLVQNNRYAISVPLERQTAAPALAYKGIGYGVRSEQVDGNDAVAVLAVLGAAVAHARSGGGPFLVEAHTYRLEPHTNADDATRYRADAETEQWRRRDPIARLKAYLRRSGRLGDDEAAAIAAEAEEVAARLRAGMNADPDLAPLDLFAHVYREPTPQLAEQRALLRSELQAEEVPA